MRTELLSDFPPMDPRRALGFIVEGIPDVVGYYQVGGDDGMSDADAAARSIVNRVDPAKPGVIVGAPVWGRGWGQFGGPVKFETPFFEGAAYTWIVVAEIPSGYASTDLPVLIGTNGGQSQANLANPSTGSRLAMASSGGALNAITAGRDGAGATSTSVSLVGAGVAPTPGWGVFAISRSATTLIVEDTLRAVRAQSALAKPADPNNGKITAGANRLANATYDGLIKVNTVIIAERSTTAAERLDCAAQAASRAAFYGLAFL